MWCGGAPRVLAGLCVAAAAVAAALVLARTAGLNEEEPALLGKERSLARVHPRWRARGALNRVPAHPWPRRGVVCKPNWGTARGAGVRRARTLSEAAAVVSDLRAALGRACGHDEGCDTDVLVQDYIPGIDVRLAVSREGPAGPWRLDAVVAWDASGARARDLVPTRALRDAVRTAVGAFRAQALSLDARAPSAERLLREGAFRVVEVNGAFGTLGGGGWGLGRELAGHWRTRQWDRRPHVAVGDVITRLGAFAAYAWAHVRRQAAVRAGDRGDVHDDAVAAGGAALLPP